MVLPAQASRAIFQAALQFTGAGQGKALFHEGEMVEGKVLKVISAKQALVRLSGIELVALTQTKLTQGQNIVGIVDKTEPNISVSLLKGGSTAEVKTSALMRLLLPSKAPMGAALAKVLALPHIEGLPDGTRQMVETLARDIEQAMLSRPQNASSDAVKTALLRSGLFLESALLSAVRGDKQAMSRVRHDMKALISRALDATEKQTAELTRKLDNAKTYVPTKTDNVKTAPSGAQPDNIRMELFALKETSGRLRGALHNIELNQLINSSTMDKGATVHSQALYQLPFFEGMTLETARVYIRPDGGGGKKNSGGKKRPGESSVVFMLNMSKLGPVRVDAHIGAGRVSGVIYALGQAEADSMTKRLPELLKQLEQTGYKARFEVSVANKKFVTEEIENSAPITARGVVDVKA